MRYNPFLGSSQPAPEHPTKVAPERTAKPSKQKKKAARTKKTKSKAPKQPSQLAQEALARAQIERSIANYAPIIDGFMQKGIPASEITPRVNVFTFFAWKAKGRRVRKGEHGVKITSWVPVLGKVKTEKDPKTGEEKTVASLRPKTTTVFHISQTEPIDQKVDVERPATPANHPGSQVNRAAPPEPAPPIKTLPAWLQKRIQEKHANSRK